MPDFLAFIFVLMVIGGVLTLLYKILEAVFELLEPLLTGAIVIIGGLFVIGVLANSCSRSSTTSETLTGKPLPTRIECPAPLPQEDTDAIYQEINNYLQNDDNTNIEDRFNRLDKALSLISSRLLNVDNKINSNNDNFNAFYDKLSKTLQITNDQILEMKKQLKKEYEELNRDKKHALFENIKMAYFGMIIAWAFGVFFNSDKILTKKHGTSKQNIKTLNKTIKNGKILASTFELQQLGKSFYTTTDNYSKISTYKTNILIEKTYKTSFITIVFTLIYIIIDYAYYHFYA